MAELVNATAIVAQLDRKIAELNEGLSRQNSLSVGYTVTLNKIAAFEEAVEIVLAARRPG